MTDTTKKKEITEEMAQSLIASAASIAFCLGRVGKALGDVRLQALAEIIQGGIDAYDFPEDSDESNAQVVDGGVE